MAYGNILLAPYNVQVTAEDGSVTYYYDLQDAIDNADGCEVKLCRDNVYDENIDSISCKFNNKNTIIDLNGFSHKCLSGEFSGYTKMTYTYSNSNIIFRDSSGGGSINGMQMKCIDTEYTTSSVTFVSGYYSIYN